MWQTAYKQNYIYFTYYMLLLLDIIQTGFLVCSHVQVNVYLIYFVYNAADGYWNFPSYMSRIHTYKYDCINKTSLQMNVYLCIYPYISVNKIFEMNAMCDYSTRGILLLMKNHPTSNKYTRLWDTRARVHV